MSESDSPQVIAPPPLIFLAGFLVGLVMQWLAPPHLVLPGALRWIGFVVAIASGVLAAWGRSAMRCAGTHIDPRKPALAIVSDGPFRFTRNPLYLSLVLLTIGVAMFFHLVWVLAALVPVVLIIHYGVIRREERDLASKFGQTYLDYKQRVRRWI